MQVADGKTVRKTMRKNSPLAEVGAVRIRWPEDKERNEFTAANINWVAGGAPLKTSSGASGGGGGSTVLPLEVKVRHGAFTHEAEVTLLDDGKSAHVTLAERDKGLAPGQFAAFYDGEVCLGSGVITEGAI